MSSSYPFTYKIGSSLTRHFPGAYIFRGGAGANGLIPIYNSIPSFIDNGMTDILNDRDAQVLVLPGFTLQLYSSPNYGDDAYVHTLGLIDNSGGTDLLSRTATTVASSCKLFYKSRIGFKELLTSVDIFNPVSTINTGSLTISPFYNATSTATFSGINYRLYEFKSTTMESTFSYTGSSAITMRFLLVGGGGGGGHSSAGGEVAGSGGGGAGAFVYGTIVVSPGDTFTVQIGIGGAGSSVVGFGSTSSITRTVGTAASLIAAGGGSGGGAGVSNTGAYPSGIGGSTGGTWSPGAAATGTTVYPTTVATNKHTLTGSGITVELSSANSGGSSWGNNGGSGGGGAGGAGGSVDNNVNGGGGGAGATWPVIGTSIFFAAGGGGNNQTNTKGGGGAGGSSIGGNGGSGSIGKPNTGSGGGARWDSPAGNGGSGICIIAVPI